MPSDLGLIVSTADSSKFDVDNKIGSNISKTGVQSILEQLSSKDGQQPSANL